MTCHNDPFTSPRRHLLAPASTSAASDGGYHSGCLRRSGFSALAWMHPERMEMPNGTFWRTLPAVVWLSAHDHQCKWHASVRKWRDHDTLRHSAILRWTAIGMLKKSARVGRP